MGNLIDDLAPVLVKAAASGVEAFVSLAWHKATGGGTDDDEKAIAAVNKAALAGMAAAAEAEMRNYTAMAEIPLQVENLTEQIAAILALFSAPPSGTIPQLGLPIEYVADEPVAEPPTLPDVPKP